MKFTYIDKYSPLNKGGWKTMDSIYNSGGDKKTKENEIAIISYYFKHASCYDLMNFIDTAVFHKQYKKIK